jgi:thioredoxin reductase (NADPH)
MSEDTSHDILVIGTGVAGLSAAREALRAGCKVACLEGGIFGGLILNVNALDGAIQGGGAEYASNLMGEVADLGGESIDGAVQDLRCADDTLVVTSSAGTHHARAVVVASGAALRKLGVRGEAEFEHKGVSHCADCDGPLFRDQQVVVVGGGDSAVQSALVLADYCKRVVLVHRGGSLSAQPHLIAALAGRSNVETRFDSAVEEVLGAGHVEGVRVNGEVLPCSGFFAYVGLEPASGFLPPQVLRDARGAVITGEDLQTAVRGVYAAGAVRAGCGASVADAVAEGAAAARAAAAHVRNSVAA